MSATREGTGGSESGQACSFISSRSKSVIASAVAPAKPHTTPSLSFRTLRAFGLITCDPSVTWPSPMMNWTGRHTRTHVGHDTVTRRPAGLHACHCKPLSATHHLVVLPHGEDGGRSELLSVPAVVFCETRAPAVEASEWRGGLSSRQRAKRWPNAVQQHDER